MEHRCPCTRGSPAVGFVRGPLGEPASVTVLIPAAAAVCPGPPPCATRGKELRAQPSAAMKNTPRGMKTHRIGGIRGWRLRYQGCDFRQHFLRVGDSVSLAEPSTQPQIGRQPVCALSARTQLHHLAGIQG
jgi:hypothetical protein